MAAEGKMDQELTVHQRGYAKFITAFRVSAVICFVIALIVILIIRK